jgi:hypothetical protein
VTYARHLHRRGALAISEPRQKCRISPRFGIGNDVGAANGRAPWRLLLGVGCHYPWQTDAVIQRQAQPSPRGPTQNSIRQPDRHRMPSQKPSQAVTVVTDAPPAMPSHVTHALIGV